MDEKYLQQSMELIYFAGNAKSLAMKAIECAEADNFEEAENKLKEARKELSNSHKLQTGMMQEEISGTFIEKSILLIHSQDHFMSASLTCDLAQKFINLNKKIGK